MYFLSTELIRYAHILRFMCTLCAYLYFLVPFHVTVRFLCYPISLKRLTLLDGMLPSYVMNEMDVLGRNVLGERLWPSRFHPREQRVPTLRRPGLAHLNLRFAARGRYGMMQRVIVKAHYTSPKSLKSHLRYIQREGVGLDGKKPELFTGEGRTLQTKEIEGEPRFFRIILSPEHSDRIAGIRGGMEQYTKDFMKDFERLAGRELNWCATVHYNTSSPHAHIVIRGIDAHGNSVILSPEIFKSQAREMAQQLATRELGYRTPLEIRQQIEDEILSERFTWIDRSISQKLDHTGYYAVLTPTQQERLEHLVDLGLAEKSGKSLYYLKGGWEKKLQQNGRKNDIIKAIYNEAPLGVRKQWKSADTSNQPLFIAKSTSIVRGRIVPTGFENELGEKPYVLIQAQSYGPTPGTKLYYYSHQSLKFSELKPGRQVKLERGVLYFGKEISISHALRRQRKLAPTIDVSLHKLEMLRDKKALVQAIHSQVSPKLKEHWRKNWTQTKPLYFYSQGQSVSGIVAATGIVTDPSGTRRLYVLIETTTTLKTSHLVYYSNTSLSADKIVPLSQVRLSHGKLNSLTLQEYEMNGDKQGIIRSIYESLPGQVKRRWDESGIRNMPLSFYRQDAVIRGKLAASGEITDATGKKRSYVVLQSDTGLYFFSGVTSAHKQLAPWTSVELSHGRIRSLESPSHKATRTLDLHYFEAQGDKRGIIHSIYRNLKTGA